MITAENFFNQYGGYTREEMLIRAREFAKLHVEAALKAASENFKIIPLSGKGFTDFSQKVVDKQSILNSYPLKNVK